MSALPPVPYHAGPAPEPYLVTIGDVGVTQHWVVTPRGSAPVTGSQWWLAERAAWVQQIPVWAVVLAVVLFPIGLLFLLVKEPRYSSWLDVTVQSDGLVHTTAVAAQSFEATQLAARVDYVRRLAAGAV